MAGFSFSTIYLMPLVCVLWRTWLQDFTDTHQGDEITFNQKHLFRLPNVVNEMGLIGSKKHSSVSGP